MRRGGPPPPRARPPQAFRPLVVAGRPAGSRDPRPTRAVPAPSLAPDADVPTRRSRHALPPVGRCPHGAIRPTVHPPPCEGAALARQASRAPAEPCGDGTARSVPCPNAWPNAPSSRVRPILMERSADFGPIVYERIPPFARVHRPGHGLVPRARCVGARMRDGGARRSWVRPGPAGRAPGRVTRSRFGARRELAGEALPDA